MTKETLVLSLMENISTPWQFLWSKNPCKTGTGAVFKETFNSKNGLEFSYKNRIVQTIDTTNPP